MQNQYEPYALACATEEDAVFRIWAAHEETQEQYYDPDDIADDASDTDTF